MAAIAPINSAGASAAPAPCNVEQNYMAPCVTSAQSYCTANPSKMPYFIMGAGVLALVLLPGWWKLLALPIGAVGVVSSWGTSSPVFDSGGNLTYSSSGNPQCGNNISM